MKSQIFLMLMALGLCSTFSFAQTKNTNTSKLKEDKIEVWGNCGMCKSRIEKAAKAAGAATANWDEDTKVLTVKYAANKTNNEKIQKQVAAVGHDTKDFTATDAVYDKLHGCCKYDRKAAPTSDQAAADCCKDKANCPKDGSCCKPGSTATCCVDKANCKADGSCCKASSHDKAMDCCKDKANCPKDGSCCKPGSTATCCVDKANCKADGNCCKASNDKAMACCKDKTTCKTDGSCCTSAKGCCSK